MQRISSKWVSLLLALVPALMLQGNLWGQRDSVYTPRAGSSERKAIMDGLRVPIEKKLHQKVIFVVNHLKVKGNWAFTITIPKQPNGKPVDYQKTAYKDMVRPGEEVGDAFSGEAVGLLKKSSGRWKTVDYCIGPSDVCWEGWDKKYNAPKEIMHIE